jgi:hypothetical protein
LAFSSSSLATANWLALVVQFEDGHLAALAVDDAQVADDAGQQLRVAAVQHVSVGALGKQAHLGGVLVKHVARHIEAQGGFLEQQTLADGPRLRDWPFRLLA